MTDPPRLFSTPESELERALLDAGRSYTASGSARTKTLLSLGLTAVTTSSAPAAAASSALRKAALSKVAVTVLVLGAVAVPVWRYLNHRASTPVAHPAVVAAAAPAPLPATHHATAEFAPAAIASREAASIAATEPTEPTEAQPSTSPRSANAAHSAPKAASAPPLTAELAALDAARTSLAHADPAAALVALDGYARNFPRGRLKIEAEVLRIGALAKSGQTETARKRADTFLRLHPDSVLASRVRSYAGL